jgi:putative ABC transport system permease protein
MGTLIQDLRFGLGMLRKSPGFTAVAVLSLALGIGGTIAIFSVMYALLLKPLPVSQPDRLVDVSRDGVNLHSYAVWKQLRDRQDIFTGLFAYYVWDDQFTIADEGESQQIPVSFVSGEFFQTLGIPAILGRTLMLADDQPGAAPVCMIDYGLWQRQYGESTSVLGHVIVLNGQAFQLIGVTPRSFFGVKVGSKPAVYVPLETRRLFHNQRFSGSGVPMPKLEAGNALSIIGRLKPGISMGPADARLQVLGTEIYKSLSQGRFSGGTLAARPLPGGVFRSDFSKTGRGYFSGTLVLMITMAGVALVITCTNLSNLLLARATRRQGEIATRLALGATRWRLIQQLLTESVVLSVAGTAVGLLLARWASEPLLQAISDYPIVLDLSWNTTLVAFSIGISLLSALLFGLAPSIRATRISLYSAMNNAPTVEKRGGRLTNSVLVVAQVALSVVVLVSAGLLVQTLHALLAKDPGYEPKGVLVAQVSLKPGNENPRREAFEGDELLKAFRSVPSVVSTSWTANFSQSTFAEVSIPQLRGSDRHTRGYRFFVSPDFFKTRRTPILAGRDFDAGDTETSVPVGILSEQAAKAFFGNLNPIGSSFRESDFGTDGQEYSVRVVGIVKNMDFQGPQFGPLTVFFRPVSQCSACLPMGRYEIRFTSPMSSMANSLKTVASNVDSNLATKFHPLEDEINDGVRRNRALAQMATIFSLFVGLLAMIGVYGVTSYATAERTREIGIRMTLGAQPGNVLRMILRDSISFVLIGIIVGVLAGFGAAQTLRGILWGVTPTDLLSFASAVCLMLFVAGIAAFLPARRAIRVDPMIALRYE